MKPADELRATLRESHKPILRFTRGHVKEYAALLDECERDLDRLIKAFPLFDRDKWPTLASDLDAGRATLAKLRGEA